jgi:hypothetical protein
MEHKYGILIDKSAISSAVLVKGTIMAKVTATGLYVPYSDAGEAGAAGTGVAVGVLTDDTPLAAVGTTDANDLRLPAVIYIHGDFIESTLTGLDAAAKADLKSRSIGTWLTF